MQPISALEIAAVFLICTGPAAAGGATRPETFVIHESEGGREATIRIPVSAVSGCSANAAEALVDYAVPQVEAMRLRGNVRIDVIGASQPIEIQADAVVLELTADETPAQRSAGSPAVRAAAQPRPMRMITVQTAAGAMQITADRVEHSARAAADI
jgi:hypothetical protein